MTEEPSGYNSNSRVVYFEPGIRTAIQKITPVINRDKKEIVLNWDYQNKDDITKTLIYRAKGENPFILYQTLEDNPQSFTDKNLTPNTIYKYKIKLFFKGGIASELSKEIRVNY